jgi:hypothetical protein
VKKHQAPRKLHLDRLTIRTLRTATGGQPVDDGTGSTLTPCPNYPWPRRPWSEFSQCSFGNACPDPDTDTFE